MSHKDQFTTQQRNSDANEKDDDELLLLLFDVQMNISCPRGTLMHRICIVEMNKRSRSPENVIGHIIRIQAWVGV